MAGDEEREDRRIGAGLGGEPGGRLTHAMKRVGQRYVQYINRTYRRTGPLFEGRFRSSLIDADAYLLACRRYVELNPVRARMVATPGESPWSSYGANGLGRDNPVITRHALYEALGDASEDRLTAYQTLFERELSADLLQAVRESTNGGFVLGNHRFAQQIAAMLGRRTWKGSPGRPRKREDEGTQGKQGELTI